MPAARLERPTLHRRDTARRRPVRAGGWRGWVEPVSAAAGETWGALDRIAGGGLALKLRRLGRKASGWAFLGLGGALILALATHHAGDPSFNVASGAPARNLMGGMGAALADLGLTLFGFAAFALAAPLLAWGVFCARGLKIRRLPLRMLMAPLALALLAAGLAFLPAPPSWPLTTGPGGLAGDGLFGALSGLADLGPGIPLSPLVALICAGGGAALLVYAAGWTWQGVGAIAGRTARWVAVPAGAAGRIALNRLHAYADRRERARAEAGEDGDTDFGEEDPPAPASWTARLSGMLGFGRKEPDEDHERVEPGFGHDDGGAEDGDEIEAAETPAPKRPQTRIEPRIEKPAVASRESKRAKSEAQAKLDLADDGEYQLPPLALLAKPKPQSESTRESPEALEQNARMLETVLADFGVRGVIGAVKPGPVVTMYELEPAAGIKASRVIGLADDIARMMSAVSARIAVVPGRNVIGIELPNRKRETVYLRELLSADDYENPNAALTMALGKDIAGGGVFADLARMPHLLIAGTTGSGKSVGINTMILSLLYRHTPETCRMIMVDPKMLELSVYEGIPHLLAPVVTEPKKAVVALKWAVREMEDRYRAMSKLGVRNIDGFNERVRKALAKGETMKRRVQTGFDPETGEAIFEEETLDLKPLPYIVIVIDEMADLMIVAGKEIEALVQRLAQMARAAGLHVIMATQRPSVDVITGTIKANFPTRISFQVTSKIDSRTILGEQGAEQLLGQGDMLFMAGGGRIRRVHGPFVSDTEVEEVVKHLKAQGFPEYVEAVTQDEDDEDAMDAALGLDGEGGSGDALYDQAVAVVKRDRKVSTSYIQRRLQIGYNRAARIIERMEEEGVVTAPNHQGKRDILGGE
jgi:DNA segregation ATPase FtsK/SpoIIIE, S-DNA-T family